MKFEVEVPDGKRAEWIDNVLTLVDEPKIVAPNDIAERIKTFEDAYKWCKENGKHALIEQYNDGLNVGLQRSPDIIAYLKLRIIICALNEGWEPTFEESEERWEPYWDNKGIDTLDCPSTFINYPTRLSFKRRELAIYAAKQFSDIYMDFCFKGR